MSSVVATRLWMFWDQNPALKRRAIIESSLCDCNRRKHLKQKRPGEFSPGLLNFYNWLPYAFQIMSATVLPAGMKGSTWVE